MNVERGNKYLPLAKNFSTFPSLFHNNNNNRHSKEKRTPLNNHFGRQSLSQDQEGADNSFSLLRL